MSTGRDTNVAAGRDEDGPFRDLVELLRCEFYALPLETCEDVLSRYAELDVGEGDGDVLVSESRVLRPSERGLRLVPVERDLVRNFPLMKASKVR